MSHTVLDNVGSPILHSPHVCSLRLGSALTVKDPQSRHCTRAVVGFENRLTERGISEWSVREHLHHWTALFLGRRIQEYIGVRSRLLKRWIDVWRDRTRHAGRAMLWPRTPLQKQPSRRDLKRVKPMRARSVWLLSSVRGSQCYCHWTVSLTAASPSKKRQSRGQRRVGTQRIQRRRPLADSVETRRPR